ncbi:hypothetical protein GCM10025777_57230 [Membranihabitans marinus]
MAIVVSLLFFSCQSRPQVKRLGKPKITSKFRYLEHNKGLEGQVDVYQRNKLDSLVPDPQLYTFYRSDKRLHSRNIDNNYHSYKISDTLTESTIKIQLRPWKIDLNLEIPETPKMTFDSISISNVMVVDWTSTEVNRVLLEKMKVNADESYEISIVFTDTEKTTLLKTSPLSEGKILITPEELINFKPGIGSVYTIIRKREQKELTALEWSNEIETYSSSTSITFTE